MRWIFLFSAFFVRIASESGWPKRPNHGEVGANGAKSINVHAVGRLEKAV